MLESNACQLCVGRLLLRILVEYTVLPALVPSNVSPSRERCICEELEVCRVFFSRSDWG